MNAGQLQTVGYNNHFSRKQTNKQTCRKTDAKPVQKDQQYARNCRHFVNYSFSWTLRYMTEVVGNLGKTLNFEQV